MLIPRQQRIIDTLYTPLYYIKNSKIYSNNKEVRIKPSLVHSLKITILNIEHNIKYQDDVWKTYTIDEKKHIIQAAENKIQVYKEILNFIFNEYPEFNI